MKELAMKKLAGVGVLCFIVLMALAGCGGSNGNSGITVTVAPDEVTLAPRDTQQFTATVRGDSNTGVTWRVQESDGGTIDDQGNYQAPDHTGDFHVIATSIADPAKSDMATVHVRIGVSTKPYYTGTITLTRTGAGQTFIYNEQETIQVNQLCLDNDNGSERPSGWHADHTQIEASANFVNIMPGNPNITISSNGWQDPRPDTYWVSMILDPTQKTLKFIIASFSYECTYTPQLSAEYLPWTVGGAVFTADLPVNPSFLSGSITLNPDPFTGANLEVSWNLTRKN